MIKLFPPKGKDVCCAEFKLIPQRADIDFGDLRLGELFVYMANEHSIVMVKTRSDYAIYVRCLNDLPEPPAWSNSLAKHGLPMCADYLVTPIALANLDSATGLCANCQEIDCECEVTTISSAE